MCRGVALLAVQAARGGATSPGLYNTAKQLMTCCPGMKLCAACRLREEALQM